MAPRLLCRLQQLLPHNNEQQLLTNNQYMEVSL